MPLVRRIVLVTIDGLPADAVQRPSMSNYRRLIERGSTAEISRGIASWVPLLSGVSSSIFFDREIPQLRHAVGRVDPVPRSVTYCGYQTSSFMSEADPATRAALLLQARDLGFQQMSFRGNNSADIVRSAVPALCNQRRGLIALHLSTLIETEADWSSSKDLLDPSDRIDQSLGILASLSGALTGDTLLVAVARDDQRFGSVTYVGRNVNTGPLGETELTDVAATLLWSLGVSIPAGYSGVPSSSIFRGEDDGPWSRIGSYEASIT